MRYAEFYEMVEMPSGMYARSEGPEVASLVTVVHPDDFRHLLDGKSVEQVCFNTVKAEQPDLVPDFLHCVDTDLVEFGEDGEFELADRIFLEMRKVRDRDFRPPEFQKVPFVAGTGMEKWPRMPYKALEYKERSNR